MFRYIIRRLIAIIPILFVVGTIVFLLIQLMPGNPARQILGADATQEEVEKLEVDLGLDEPLPIYYVKWLGNLLKGDMGESIYTGDKVLSDIISHIGPTLSISLLALSITLLIALPIGILAVRKRDSWLDPTFMSLSLLGVSIPEFWFALLLILGFSVTIPIFPTAGYVPITEDVASWLHYIILPAIVLAMIEVGLIARMLRDGMLEGVNQDYTKTARSKGLKEGSILVKHVFPNALIPTTTVIGVSVAGLLGGTVIVETIFTIPGIGHLLIDSIHRRDFPVVQGSILFISTVYVLVNLLIDIVYALLDPRIKYD